MEIYEVPRWLWITMCLLSGYAMGRTLFDVLDIIWKRRHGR